MADTRNQTNEFVTVEPSSGSRFDVVVWHADGNESSVVLYDVRESLADDVCAKIARALRTWDGWE